MRAMEVLNDFAGPHRDTIDPASAAIFNDGINRIVTETDVCESVDVVLAGFPYKSPNTTERVMGDIPDFGELAAIRRLVTFRDHLANAINRDVNVIICSDGHVFNDLKAIPDEVVDRYRNQISCLASPFGESIAIRGLGDYLASEGTSSQREEFLEEYVDTDTEMKALIEENASARLLHLNLSIFARHDLVRKPGETKRELKQRCSDTALQILARSTGWSRLIKTAHPDAIRLSVHPYTDVSEKFPIQLVSSVDKRWRTPWHNVPIIRPGQKDPLLAPKAYATEQHMYAVDRTNRIIGKSNQNEPWAYVDNLC